MIYQLSAQPRKLNVFYVLLWLALNGKGVLFLYLLYILQVITIFSLFVKLVCIDVLQDCE